MDTLIRYTHYNVSQGDETPPLHFFSLFLLCFSFIFNFFFHSFFPLIIFFRSCSFASLIYLSLFRSLLSHFLLVFSFRFVFLFSLILHFLVFHIDLHTEQRRLWWTCSDYEHAEDAGLSAQRCECPRSLHSQACFEGSNTAMS